MEQIRTNRMFLRSIGVSLDGPTWVLCDNLAVVRAVSAPDQVLRKKHLVLVFHIACEAVANGMIQTLHVLGEHNLVDVCTKPLTSVVLDRLMLSVLYDEKKDSTLLTMDWLGGN